MYSPRMDLVSQLLRLVASAGLGLLMGALLAEGALFIPYWRSLSAPSFYALHKDWGNRLYLFFAPLTTASTVAAVAAAVVTMIQGGPGRWASLLAGLASLSLVAIYFAYFEGGNARLAEADMKSAELAEELARWERWHWTRVLVGIVSFVASLLALQPLSGW